MRPKLQFSVPCLGYEEPNNVPCLLYLFYDLPFKEFPAPLAFHLANGWCGGQGTFNQSVKVVAPDRSEMLDTGNRDFTLDSPTKPFLSVFEFRIGLEKEGVYWIRTFLEGELVMEVPFTVRLADPATLATAPPEAAVASPPAPPPATSLQNPDQQFLMP
ncbi:MAG: hypothetical protein AB1758_00010 [Candidatus Eremiobacterota bacterium]